MHLLFFFKDVSRRPSGLRMGCDNRCGQTGRVTPTAAQQSAGPAPRRPHLREQRTCHNTRGRAPAPAATIPQGADAHGGNNPSCCSKWNHFLLMNFKFDLRLPCLVVVGGELKTPQQSLSVTRESCGLQTPGGIGHAPQSRAQGGTEKQRAPGLLEPCPGQAASHPSLRTSSVNTPLALTDSPPEHIPLTSLCPSPEAHCGRRHPVLQAAPCPPLLSSDTAS